MFRVSCEFNNFSFTKPKMLNEVAALEIIQDHSVYYKVRQEDFKYRGLILYLKEILLKSLFSKSEIYQLNAKCRCDRTDNAVTLLCGGLVHCTLRDHVVITDISCYSVEFPQFFCLIPATTCSRSIFEFSFKAQYPESPLPLVVMTTSCGLETSDWLGCLYGTRIYYFQMKFRQKIPRENISLIEKF